MGSAFLRCLNLSISAGYLVLAVLAVRLLLRRGPKWIHVALWGLVGLRLILPVSIESAVSLIPSAEVLSPEAVRTAPAPTITSGIELIDQSVNPMLQQHFAADPAESVTPLFLWTEAAGAVWLLGFGVMLGYALISFLRLKRQVAPSIRSEGNIYQCDTVAVPFILGILRPKIYLPSGLDKAERESILAHEKAHLARRDHWWKPLGFLLLSVYWFHPLLWLAYALFCRDIEMACDEKVIRSLGPQGIRAYSAVLLSCARSRKNLSGCPLAFGEVGVKERIRRMLHRRPPTLWLAVLSVPVCAAAAVCFGTDPQRSGMRWAKSLNAQDIVSLELLVQPQAAAKQYKVLSSEEFPAAADLINQSRGRYVPNPESLSGGSVTLYVTTADGVRHTVRNEGNTYLHIDGDAYKAPYADLSAWPYTEGDAPLPEAVDLDTGRFCTENWSIPILGDYAFSQEGYVLRSSGVPGAFLAVGQVPDVSAYLEESLQSGMAAKRQGECYYIAPQEEGAAWADYLYPISDRGEGYLVHISWSRTGMDSQDPRLLLTRRQLELMAAGFRLPEGAGPPETPSRTGYAAYDALIAQVETARTAEDAAAAGFSSDLLPQNDYYQTPGWTLADLDADGTPELLLGAQWDEDTTVIFNLYCLNGDGGAIQLADGWSRSRYRLCRDGSLVREWSGSSTEFGWDRLVCEQKGLTIKERLYHSDSELFRHSGGPWYHAQGDGEFSLTDSTVNPAYRPVSEAEAQALRDRYPFAVLPLTPFGV